MSQHMVGADAEALDLLARQLSEAARAMDHITARLGAAVTHAPWHGPHGDRFRADWSRTHRGQLLAAAHFLREAQKTAQQNAADQRAASSGSGAALGVGVGAVGLGLGVSGAAYLTRLNARIDPWSKWLLGPAGTGVGLLDKLSANRMVVGRYSDAWRHVMQVGSKRGIPADFFQFKQSPITHYVHPWHAGFAAASRGLDVVNTGVGVVSTASDLQQHHYVTGGLDAAGTAAGVVKSHGGVLGYATGVAMQTWVQAGKAAQTVDWSANGMRQLQQASLGDWVSGFGDSAKQMPGQLWTIFS